MLLMCLCYLGHAMLRSMHLQMNNYSHLAIVVFCCSSLSYLNQKNKATVIIIKVFQSILNSNIIFYVFSWSGSSTENKDKAAGTKIDTSHLQSVWIGGSLDGKVILLGFGASSYSISHYCSLLSWFAFPLVE